MGQKTDSLNLHETEKGWIYVGLLALGFAILYLLNFLLPLYTSSYTTRVWNWAQWAVTLGALLQVKRSFESAAAFHWFIDFSRFLFGY